MTAAFNARYRIRFAHCDPAGIAYYPRYFEICDGAVEDWCEQRLGVPRRRMHLEMNLGMPTVDLQASFVAPSRLGDWLDIALSVDVLGASSVTLLVRACCEGEERFTLRLKQVLMKLDVARSTPWPDDWRRLLEQMRMAEAA